jgi:hypothetical protein
LTRLAAQNTSIVARKPGAGQTPIASPHGSGESFRQGDISRIINAQVISQNPYSWHQCRLPIAAQKETVDIFQILVSSLGGHFAFRHQSSKNLRQLYVD